MAWPEPARPKPRLGLAGLPARPIARTPETVPASGASGADTRPPCTVRQMAGAPHARRPCSATRRGGRRRDKFDLARRQIGMDPQVFPQIADVTPLAPVKHHTGKRLTRAQSLQPDGDKGRRLPGVNAPEQFRRNDANAGVKKTRVTRTKLTAEIGNPPARRIEADLQGPSAGPQGQSAQRAAVRVCSDQSGQIQLGEDVPVVDQHRTGQEEILHIFQAAGGIQEERFMTEKHRHPGIARRMGVFGKKTDELVGQPVRVDHDALHARRGKAR